MSAKHLLITFASVGAVVVVLGALDKYNVGPSALLNKIFPNSPA